MAQQVLQQPQPRYTPPQIEELRRLEQDFDVYMAASPATQLNRAAEGIRLLPPLLTGDEALMADIYARLDYLAWLESGPDDYDAIDDTITSSYENPYRYDPDVLWAITLKNNAASGGANLLIRFNDSYGRVGQYKVVPGDTLNMSQIKGGLGSRFRAVSDGTSIEMTGLVTIHEPYLG